ncbi:MAG TPA: hypothetical protein VH682_30225 [Gemmataceae bacterium]
MKRLLLSALLLAGSTALCRAADFEPPLRCSVEILYPVAARSMRS